MDKFSVHDIAYAYIPGKTSPLKQSASVHCTYNYSLRVDFKDFFPSIRPQDLISQLSKSYVVNSDDSWMIDNALFFFDHSTASYFLPVGSPSSPSISNIVMRDIDDVFLRLSLSVDSKSSISRYADDLYFSTNIKGACAKYYHCIDEVLKKNISPMLTINVGKTLYLSRGTKRIVNGLYITHDGNVTIGRERKTLIKSWLYKFSKGMLDEENIKKACGMLAFIQDCEPAYYNKLALKYGDVFYSVKNYK